MNERERLTVLATPALGCVACESKTLHSEADWRNHPYRGHGFVKNYGWTHPDLARPTSARSGAERAPDAATN